MEPSKRYKNTSTLFGVDIEPQGEFGIMDLGIGDPNFTTNKKVIDATYQDMLAGHTHYTSPLGDEQLRNEIVKQYKDDYNYDISLQEIFVVTGAGTAMYLILETLCEEDSEVLVPMPYYPPYPDQIRLVRANCVFVDTQPNNFRLSPKILDKYLSPKTKCLILNTPNNPTGVCLSKSELQDIANWAIKNNIIVIADDIYTTFSYENEFVPICSLPQMRERTITINSASKNYAMTGWRVGAIIAPPNIINIIRTINESITYTTPSPSQRGFLHALRNRKEIQNELANEFKKRLIYTADRINAIPTLSTNFYGAFYLFVNIQKTGMTSVQFVNKFVENCNVLVLPGVAFGTEGYVRIACIVGMDELKCAMDKLENWLKTTI